jgi:hypothetical protein
MGKRTTSISRLKWKMEEILTILNSNTGSKPNTMILNLRMHKASKSFFGVLSLLVTILKSETFKRLNTN